MAKVVGIGGSVYDMMMVLDQFPEKDTKCNAKQLKVQCGGPCAVAMIAASKLGVDSAFIGGVGNDAWGSYEMGVLSSYGVDISHMKVFDSEVSRVCLVMVNSSNAARTCIGGGGSASFAMRPEDVPDEVLDGAEYVHVDGSNIAVASEFVKKAKAKGVKVCYDADGIGPNMDLLLPYVDELIPSERCIQALAGTKDTLEAAKIVYEKYRPGVMVVTMGPKGGIIIEGGMVATYKAFPVEVVDSNGAGDIFHGAYLAARVRGYSVKAACEYASATSALKCTRLGGAEGCPTEPEVLEFLRERKEQS